MQQFGPFKVSVRLPGDAEHTEDEIREQIALALAELFAVDVYDPEKTQGHRPHPGVTVESL